MFQEGILFRGDSKQLTNHYVRNFISRHRSLDSSICQGIDQRRADNAKAEVVKSFFDFVADLVKKYKIKVFFNLDETGFSGQEMKKRKFKVLHKKNIRAGKKGRVQVRYPEFSGHVTVEACCGSNGHVFSPYFIFEGTNFTNNFVEALKEARDAKCDKSHEIPGARYKMGGKNEDGKPNKGGMNRKLFADYIKTVFLAELRPDELPALLFVDGHDSHFDTETLRLLKARNVHVVQLPSNLRYSHIITSHPVSFLLSLKLEN